MFWKRKKPDWRALQDDVKGLELALVMLNTRLKELSSAKPWLLDHAQIEKTKREIRAVKERLEAIRAKATVPCVFCGASNSLNIALLGHLQFCGSCNMGLPEYGTTVQPETDST